MSIHPYLGVNVSPASAEELRHRGVITEEEVLLALFDGMLLDENRRRVGGLALNDFVALTDQRLITWARGFFSDSVDGFPWSDVDVIDHQIWDPFHGRVLLALRLPPVAPRQRRIAVGGSQVDPGSGERVLVNTLDYMPADDSGVMAKMVAWVGDQVVAGVTGEALVQAFSEQFPLAEKPAPMPFFTVDPDPPMVSEVPAPEAAAPSDATKRRWWQSNAAASPGVAAPRSPGDLIASYESQRPGGAPPSPAAGLPPGMELPPTMPMMPGMGLPEQPNMYEVSRSLRLMLEAPRKLARMFGRANEMVSGASELVGGMQNPQVRRTAMRGLYHAAAQHEAEGGPLASVAPVVRAAVRFSEPLEAEQVDPQTQRRIKVAPSRQRPPAASVPVEQPVAPPESAAPPAQAPVRRSLSVRRVDPPAETPPPAAAPPPAEVPARNPVPVRRISLNRSTEPLDTQPVALNGNGNGNGHHEY
jgi:hypothetical protein